MGGSFNIVDHEDHNDDNFEQHYELVDDPNQDDFSFSSAEEDEHQHQHQHEHDNGDRNPDDNGPLSISYDCSSSCHVLEDVGGSSSFSSFSHPWTLVTATSLSHPDTNHSTKTTTPKYQHGDETKSTLPLIDFELVVASTAETKSTASSSTTAAPANTNTNTNTSSDSAAANDPPGLRSLVVDEEEQITTLHPPIQTDMNKVQTILLSSDRGHTTLPSPTRDLPTPTLFFSNVLYKTTSYILASHHAKRQGRLLLVHVLPPNEKENNENGQDSEQGSSNSVEEDDDDDVVVVASNPHHHHHYSLVLNHLLATKFVVWQCTAQSPGGLHFSQNYPVSCYPHLSILDPQCGKTHLPRLLACREGHEWQPSTQQQQQELQHQQLQQPTCCWTAQELVNFLTLDHPSAKVKVSSLAVTLSKQHWPNKEKQNHNENDKSDSSSGGTSPRPASSLSLSLSLQQQ